MIKNITILFVLFFTIVIHGQEEKYSIQNLSINNHYSNFGTTFFGEDKVVYASPTKKTFIVRNVWKGNNQPFLDLYVGDIAKDGQLINEKKFSNKLNTRYHEADVAFTKDKKTVYFSRNNYLNNKLTKDSTNTGLIQLYRAKIDLKGEWINVEAMHFNNDEYQTGHPTLSADEKTLYFISDMPGGFGKTDVYKAKINDDGSIGNPINLGAIINTPEKEMFVSISGNNELYFSSDGREDSLGELDIYVSKITENNITEPQNLGAPINSIKDDFSFIINYETRRGYFSSNRLGGKGDDDIYTFVQNIPIEFECNQIVKGDVTDKNSGELLPGALVVLYNDLNNELNRAIVGDDARFNFEVDCNKSYKIVCSKDKYSTDIEEFYSTEEVALELPLSISLEEFVLEGGKCIIKINPIYFDFDKSFIRPDAEIELNKVVEVMNKFPELIIEGGSHTDSRGTYKYNESLSTRRAKSTVKYIIEKGINPNRINAKGYGESQLVNGCGDGVKCTDEAHQMNRRTEFVIVNYNEIKEKYPQICPSPKPISEIEKVEKQKILDIVEHRNGLSFESEFDAKDDKLRIKLNPIYFDLNSSYFGKDAEVELKRVVEIMVKYPDALVQCGSHTDSRASDKYNMWLSERRAKRIVDYISSKGISSNRIIDAGFGETQLINKCANGIRCTDVEHQQNRRTEFIILNPEVIKN